MTRHNRLPQSSHRIYLLKCSGVICFQMKIFWSWQSDTAGKIGRHFVRDAILDAIKDLIEAPPDVEEPTRGADRGALHLDSDRQGVPGSPDLAATIFAKIEAATVVIADVTPVGRGLVRRSKDGAEIAGRALINPNVAIELGYALGRSSKGLGNNLLMVCNAHYGTRSDLPFDLAHKAGPIFFDLAADAPRDTIAAEQKKLCRELVTALRPFLAEAETASKPAFQPTPPGANAGVWFQRGEPLGESGDWRCSDITQYTIEVSPIFYLRLTPLHARAEISRSEAENIARRLPFFSGAGGIGTKPNIWGAAKIAPLADGAPLASVTQLFLNGEVWAINFSYFNRFSSGKIFCISGLEWILQSCLPLILDTMRDHAGSKTPMRVELGFIGVTGYTAYLDEINPAGKVHAEPKPITLILRDDTAAARNELLLSLFERMFRELLQERRPENYRGFPSST